MVLVWLGALAWQQVGNTSGFFYRQCRGILLAIFSSRIYQNWTWTRIQRGSGSL